MLKVFKSLFAVKLPTNICDWENKNWEVLTYYDKSFTHLFDFDLGFSYILFQMIIRLMALGRHLPIKHQQSKIILCVTLLIISPRLIPSKYRNLKLSCWKGNRENQDNIWSILCLDYKGCIKNFPISLNICIIFLFRISKER